MNALLEGLGSLGGGSAYLVVSLLAALEASAFVGLFVPGEFAVLVGGYIAFEGRAGLVPMMIAATFGAIVGDSIGYEVGRHLGSSIRRSRLGQRVGEERWAKAENYLKAKGGRAVFFGRFVGVLRALVPGLAGASRMPYRRFLFWNALGGLVWAPTFVGVGYLAGRSYRRVEHYAGRAGLVVLVLVVLVGGVLALGRWVSRNPGPVRAFGRRLLARPSIAWVHQRYRTQILFVAQRLQPGQALGLALTLQLIALGLAGWAFGRVVQDVLAGQGAARIDRPITNGLVTRRIEWLTFLMRVVGDLGTTPVLTVTILVVGLVCWRHTRNWAPLVILASALVGGVLLADMVKPLVGRTRPAVAPLVTGVTGFAFPSGHATEAVAVYGGLAYIAAGWLRTWSSKVAVWTAALVIVVLVGFSGVYLGTHWATDVLGGYALGAVWLAVVLVTTSVVRGAWRRRRANGAVADARVPPQAAPSPSPGG